MSMLSRALNRGPISAWLHAPLGKQETVQEEIARLQSEIARLEGRLRFLVLGDPGVRVHVPIQGQTKEPE